MSIMTDQQVKGLTSALRSRRQTLDGELYLALRGKIVSLEIEPGEMISENAIAAEYGISRTPVRQAFVRLQNEELLRIIPQRGALVSKLSEAKFREAQFVRQSLEMSAFAVVARIWNSQEPRFREAEGRIRTSLRHQVAAIARKDYVKFISLDEEFHTIFLEFANNDTLISVVADMRVHLNRVRYLELTEAHHETEAIRFHRDIFKAVVANDVDRTVETVRDHLQALEGFWVGLFARHKRLFE